MISLAQILKSEISCPRAAQLQALVAVRGLSRKQAEEQMAQA